MDNTTSEEFPHEVRIVRTSDYKAIYSAGKKIHSKRFVLFGCVNAIGHARLGITVSRKIGCAVVRNRIKRLFREIFRRSLREIPNQLDIVINTKSGCVGASYMELHDEFIDTAQKFCG